MPKFSRRVKLASLATGGGNRAFNQNIANRLWAAMMGRGLVHPVDLHHPSNPPSHPELLNLLADELVATNFNVRNCLREIALTKVYQQAIDLPAERRSVSSQTGRPSRRGEGSSRTARVVCRSRTESVLDCRQGLVPERGGSRSRFLPSKTRPQRSTSKRKRRTRQLRRHSPMPRHNGRPSKEQPRSWPRPLRVRKKLRRNCRQTKSCSMPPRYLPKRSAAASSELAALEKTIADRTAALKKAGDDVAAAAQSVLAARRKVAPVREAVRHKEMIALEARRKMAEARAVAENHLARQKLLEAFVRCQKLQQRISDSSRASVAFGIALAAARKNCAELEVATPPKTRRHACDRLHAGRR